MADYYPLIARAVGTLPEQSTESRRTVYDRARSALAAQLRSVEPPLSDADLRREQTALDSAIERLEQEYGGAEPPPPPPAPPPRPVRSDVPARIAPSQPPEPAPRRPLETAPPRGRTLPMPAPPEPEVDADDDMFEPADEARPRERPRIGTRAPAVGREGRMRSVLLGVVLALVVGVIAVVAWYLRDRPAEFREPSAESQAARPSDSEAKFGDRVAGERPPGTAPQPGPNTVTPPRPDVAIAQRAIFYEENPADPQTPKTTPGRAVWRLDTLNAGQGQPLETVVRATVEVPEAGLTLNLLLRRNTDATLPASHTIDLTFTTPPGDPGRAVRDVGLFQIKSDESLRGTPVAGLPVPVRDNLFLIGLSNLRGDIERNTDLLLHRNWLDLPVRFASGQRAIISFEKGVSGEQVLSQAFEQWR